jgi:hypothetical protein
MTQKRFSIKTAGNDSSSRSAAFKATNRREAVSQYANTGYKWKAAPFSFRSISEA